MRIKLRFKSLAGLKARVDCLDNEAESSGWLDGKKEERVNDNNRLAFIKASWELVKHDFLSFLKRG